MAAQGRAVRGRRCRELAASLRERGTRNGQAAQVGETGDATKMSHSPIFSDKNVETGPTPIRRRDGVVNKRDGFMNKVARDREVARR